MSREACDHSIPKQNFLWPNFSHHPEWRSTPVSTVNLCEIMRLFRTASHIAKQSPVVQKRLLAVPRHSSQSHTKPPTTPSNSVSSRNSPQFALACLNGTVEICGRPWYTALLANLLLINTYCFDRESGSQHPNHCKRLLYYPPCRRRLYRTNIVFCFASDRPHCA